MDFFASIARLEKLIGSESEVSPQNFIKKQRIIG
jgi:hypothetical protein